jgi:hypothetical protein
MLVIFDTILDVHLSFFCPDNLDCTYPTVHWVSCGIGLKMELIAWAEAKNCLEKDTEVKVIEFLTQFRYATRKSPNVQLHAKHMHYCSDVNETKYIQGCDSINCIIPVTLFLGLLYNACFTFQHDKTTNLLISVLDHFGLGTTVDDDTPISTMSKSTNAAMISKQNFMQY